MAKDKKKEGRKKTTFGPLMHAKAGGNVIRFCNKPLSLCAHNFHAMFPDHEAGLCLPLFTIWSTGHLGHQAGFKMGRYRGRSGLYLFEYISQNWDWNNRRLKSLQMKCYFEKPGCVHTPSLLIETEAAHNESLTSHSPLTCELKWGLHTTLTTISLRLT